MTSGSDFDAAKAVADQLKGMDKERQQRILRWVAESLGLVALGGATEEMRTKIAPAPSQGAASAPQSGEQRRPTDIKTFVEVKKPKSDIHFAAVVAYYYRFEAEPAQRKESLNAETLREAARLANWKRPPQPRATLNNAKKQGYLDSAERGHFRINSVGENLVAMTLPGSESERPKRKAASKNTRKPR